MLTYEPCAVIVRRELEQRWEGAAHARLVREAKEGRVSAGPQPAPLSLWSSLLRGFAVWILGLTPSVGVA
jgi:hypothetical protein